MQKWVFTIPFACFMPWKERKGKTRGARAGKRALYRGKKYNFNGWKRARWRRNGVVGDEFSLCWFGWLTPSAARRKGKLKSKDKMCQGGGGKIMKMAACNFLIASHFTIKFIRFFSLALAPVMLFFLLLPRPPTPSSTLKINT
jgi:hypothetical protein